MKKLILFIILSVPFFCLAQRNLSAYANLYIVVADTSSNFEILKTKAYALSKVLDVPYYDNKEYNTENELTYKKEFIDENRHDDTEYLPRRLPTSEVSIEQASYYFNETKCKSSLLIIAGIFEKKDAAKAVVKKIAIHFKNVFIIKRELYLGCSH